MTVLVDKPYRFVPPHRGNLWPSVIQRLRLVDWYLRRHDGVVSYESRHVDRFQASIDAGDAILLAPNHCRYADPLTLGWPARQVGVHVHAIASWHLFAKSWLDAFAIQKMGGFSLFREGPDRQSLETAIEILAENQRPLIIFPEGTTNRTNDVLQPLLDGVAFIARTAAKRRAKDCGGRVVVHPVAIKYVFKGDIYQWGDEAAGDLEQRLGWRPRSSVALIDRIQSLAEALLATRETLYLGRAQSGPLADRRNRLVEHLLSGAEQQFGLTAEADANPLGRVRRLRSAIYPLLQEAADGKSKTPLYHALDGIEFAQQLYSYPDRYLLTAPVTDTHILETLERMQEGFIGKSTYPGPLHAVIEFAEAIPVSTERAPRGEVDPLMHRIETTLKDMLARLATEANVVIP
ncbi:MAG: 1-acyl-sn-glycerol-3-phosphate acyltransferase [Planctomycetaceae bacterium]